MEGPHNYDARRASLYGFKTHRKRCRLDLVLAGKELRVEEKMRIANTLYHLARADFLERTRRYSFLMTLGLIIFLGFAVNNGQIFLRLDGYRGEYNSAWVGSLMSLVVCVVLSLFGFYSHEAVANRAADGGVCERVSKCINEHDVDKLVGQV